VSSLKIGALPAPLHPAKPVGASPTARFPRDFHPRRSATVWYKLSGAVADSGMVQALTSPAMAPEPRLNRLSANGLPLCSYLDLAGRTEHRAHGALGVCPGWIDEGLQLDDVWAWGQIHGHDAQAALRTRNRGTRSQCPGDCSYRLKTLKPLRHDT
jgi:hypothetical protein